MLEKVKKHANFGLPYIKNQTVTKVLCHMKVYRLVFSYCLSYSSLLSLNILRSGCIIKKEGRLHAYFKPNVW